MSNHASRRSFLKKSVAATLAAPLFTSFEERVLAEQPADAVSRPTVPADKWALDKMPRGTMPMGTIGKVKISRVICGGNLISGYAHARDLMYVSPLLKHYFTEYKIMETWALSEKNGINTMILNPSDARAAAIYGKYRAQGGRIQYLAQIDAQKDDLETMVKQAQDAGAVGIFPVGNIGDRWVREGDVHKIGELVGIIKKHGLIAGVAGHEIRTVLAVEKGGYAPDFYMKTLHSNNYWSKRRSEQTKEVVDNGTDNYWCLDPAETIAQMAAIKRPWIAYKVLAAGAIHPRSGFQHAFENGADFAVVGMFDFQIAEDVAVACSVLPTTENRERKWYA
jgi:hypothetical protein